VDKNDGPEGLFYHLLKYLPAGDAGLTPLERVGYIASAVGIKITTTTTTKVIRKGPGGETIVTTTTKTLPGTAETSPDTIETSPVTLACPKCGGEILAETATCAHCGTNWKNKRQFSFRTQQKISLSSGSIKKTLVILLLMALMGAALIYLNYLK
jgi:hypothetical protein